MSDYPWRRIDGEYNPWLDPVFRAQRRADTRWPDRAPATADDYRALSLFLVRVLLSFTDEWDEPC